MLINVFGAKCIGINAVPVTVEVDISNGIGIHLVGLPDVAVKESLLRTVTAMQALGYKIPGRRIVINLAPADMHKKGSGYDLPIALGIIAASGQREMPLIDKYLIMGELGLDGTVRGVPGALPMVELAMRAGFRGCIMPWESGKEAAEFYGAKIYGVKTLSDAIDVVAAQRDCVGMLMGNLVRAWDSGAEVGPGGGVGLGEAGGSGTAVKGDPSGGAAGGAADDGVMDFAEIIGQEGAKRGMEIAAAGGHNVLLVGPPGAGKSSLSRAAANLLPPMTMAEAIETSKIYSVAGKGGWRSGMIRRRPFRSPHYSASLPALIGGGSDNIIPGEISLAHNGVLFLDEFCEVPKRVAESLRGPMEDKKVTVSRLRTKVEYPADFMLIAATNPCPCGYYGDPRCRCSPGQRAAYMARLSGPILDRIDIHLWMKPVDAASLVRGGKAETTARIAARVARARRIQIRRLEGSGKFTNASMTRQQIDTFCALPGECRDFLEKTVRQTGLSARAYHRVLKIARTIADLDAARDGSLWDARDRLIPGAAIPEISLHHLSEAIGYRFLDKNIIP